jgi:quercetin dioxygenase-like cupin family protein
MRLLDFATVVPREVAPGYLGRYLHSEHITQGRVDITPGAVIPDHSHPHEQWTLLLSGSFELTVSGVSQLLHPGRFSISHPTNAIPLARLLPASYSMCFIRLGTTIVED